MYPTPENFAWKLQPVMSDFWPQTNYRRRTVKNVKMTFYIRDSSFPTTYASAQYGLQNLDKATIILEKAENELRGSFIYLQFDSKCDHLRHAHNNYAF